jgi:hypothetical protein
MRRSLIGRSNDNLQARRNDPLPIHAHSTFAMTPSPCALPNSGWLETQNAGDRWPVSIRRITPAFIDLHGLEIERANAFKTCNIDAQLVGIGPSLMVGVNPAFLAEVMLRRLCVELIKGEIVLAGCYGEPIQVGRYNDRAAHTAE